MSLVRMVGGPFDGRDVELPECPPIVRIGHPIRMGLPPDTIETYERRQLADVMFHAASVRALVSGSAGGEAT